jgi:hypothetical protein
MEIMIRSLTSTKRWANLLILSFVSLVAALQGKEDALGPDHTSTLDTVNNLGLLYANQGKLAEAEKMYIRALQRCEEALGPDHTSTLSTVNNQRRGRTARNALINTSC